MAATNPMEEIYQSRKAQLNFWEVSLAAMKKRGLTPRPEVLKIVERLRSLLTNDPDRDTLPVSGQRSE